MTAHIPKNDADAKPFTGATKKVRAKAVGGSPYGRYRAGIKWGHEFQEADVTDEQLELLREDPLIVIESDEKSDQKPLNEQAPETVLPHLALAPPKAESAPKPKAPAKADAKADTKPDGK